MTIDAVLSDIATAAGFSIGQQYTAQQVVQRLLDQGRQHGDEKVVELLRERDKLHAAMIECRHQLMGLSMATEGAERTAICRASNVLSRALGMAESSHGRETQDAS